MKRSGGRVFIYRIQVYVRHIIRSEGEAVCVCVLFGIADHLSAAEEQAPDRAGPRNTWWITCALLSSLPLVVAAPSRSKFA